MTEAASADRPAPLFADEDSEAVPSGVLVPLNTPSPDRVGGPADYLLAVWTALLAAVSGLVSVFFLPWRVGPVPVPLAALASAAMVYWAVRTSHRLTRSMWVAALPLALWLLGCGWLSRVTTLGYPLVLGDWRGQVLLGVGTLSGAVALGSAWGDQIAGTSNAPADRTRRATSPGAGGRSDTTKAG